MKVSIETNVKKPKSYKVLSEAEIKKEATKLSKDKNKYVADVGKAILKVLVKGAGAVTDLLSAVNVLIFTAPIVLGTVLVVVVSTLLFVTTITPPYLISKALIAQKRFLKSVLKNIDEPTRQYFNAIDDIAEDRITITEESVNEFSLLSTVESVTNWDMVLEAPKEDEATDYTKNINNPDNEDEPTDYTQDVEPTSDDVTTDDEPETVDDTEPEDNQDEPTDYTQDVEPTGDDDSTDVTTDDDMSNDDTSTDSTNDENNTIKNYNLLVDFQNMHRTIGEILNSLHNVVYPQPIQNQVLTKGINNLQEIKELVEKYIDYEFDGDYKKNTYYYTIYLQAITMNLEMLKKNCQLDNE